MSRHRVCCHALVSASFIRRNVIVRWDDDDVASTLQVEPFVRETPSTTVLNGILVLMPGGCDMNLSADPLDLGPSLLDIQRRLPPTTPTCIVAVEF